MALALLTMSISGCVTASSNACPHVREYSKATETTAADELKAMDDSSVIKTVMMPDYGTLRAGARACSSN